MKTFKLTSFFLLISLKTLFSQFYELPFKPFDEKNNYQRQLFTLNDNFLDYLENETNANAKYKLDSIVGNIGSFHFTYDESGRLLKEKVNNECFLYSYHPNGKIKTVTLITDELYWTNDLFDTLKFEYDVNRNLIHSDFLTYCECGQKDELNNSRVVKNYQSDKITTYFGGNWKQIPPPKITDTIVETFIKNTFGRDSLVYKDDLLIEEYFYNSDNKLKSKIISVFDYIIHQENPNNTAIYTYDSLERITSYNRLEWVDSLNDWKYISSPTNAIYTYINEPNKETRIGFRQNNEYKYDTTITTRNSFGSVISIYKSDGRIRKIEEFDAEGRVTRMEETYLYHNPPSKTENVYVYTGDGKILNVAKYVNDIYQGNNFPAFEYDANGNLIRSERSKVKDQFSNNIYLSQTNFVIDQKSMLSDYVVPYYIRKNFNNKIVSHSFRIEDGYLSKDSAWYYYSPLVLTGFEAKDENLETYFYPNPVSNTLFISEQINYKNGIIKIQDLKGQLLLETYLDNTKREINISALEKGIYLISFLDDEVKITEKIYIE